MLDVVTRVSRPGFVAAVARQGDGHAFACRRRHVVRRHGRGIRERLVEVPRELREQIAHVRIGDDRMVLAPKVIRDGLGMRQLVERLFDETHRGRDDRCVAGFDHVCDDRGGVDPPGEKRAERHVADEAQPHGLAQQRVELVQVLRLARRVAVAGELQVPVLPHLDTAALGNQQMSGRQLVDMAVDRRRTGDVLERQIRIQAVRPPVARDRRGPAGST